MKLKKEDIKEGMRLTWQGTVLRCLRVKLVGREGFYFEGYKGYEGAILGSYRSFEELEKWEFISAEYL